MNAKLIAVAIAAFVAGHDIAITRANRRYRELESTLANEERAEISLTWFHLGYHTALNDKEKVREAFSKHFPPAPNPDN